MALFALMETYTNLRGLEQVMYDIYDEPEMLNEAMERIAAGYHSLLDQYVEYGLLDLNNNQAYSGSGGLNYIAICHNFRMGQKTRVTLGV